METFAIETDKESEGITQEEIDYAIAHNNGVIEVKHYKLEDLPDDILEEIFKVNPEYVMKHRPDFISNFHSTVIN